MERAEVALGRLSLASVVAPSPLSPPTTEPDGDPMVERVAELYGPLSLVQGPLPRLPLRAIPLLWL
jgi:hypothetical protein